MIFTKDEKPVNLPNLQNPLNLSSNKKRTASLRFYHLLVEMRGVEPLSKKPVP